MRRATLTVMVGLLASGVMLAQGFECQSVGAFPTTGSADCENVVANTSTGTGVYATATCGMPSAGLQYARVESTARMDLGAGVFATRPLAYNISEIRVFPPTGATSVHFEWNWFTNESANSSFNDGFEVALVDSLGNTIQVLVHKDTFTAFAPAGCTDSVGGGVDVGADGAETFTASFAALPAGAFLSIATWNGGDTNVQSAGVVDCIAWNNLELGNTLLPRVVDVSVQPSFTIGFTTRIQLQAGLSFIEGFHCLAVQLFDGNTIPQVIGGFAGALFLGVDRPLFPISEGLLQGGLNAGNSQIKSFFTNDPSLCGLGVIIQAYVTTEIATNPTFSTALVGFLKM